MDRQAFRSGYRSDRWERWDGDNRRETQWLQVTVEGAASGYAWAVPVRDTCVFPGTLSPASASVGSIPFKIPDGFVSTKREKM